MALVNCPICGKSISDKAEKCVRCGYNLKSRVFIRCRDCGAVLEDDETICKNCGCLIEDEVEETVTIENVTTSHKKELKKTIAITIGIIIIAVIAYFALDYSKANREYDYYCDMVDAYNTILDSSKNAEACGNLVMNVWHDAIWKEWDNDTKAYTMKNGSYVSDFNDALDCLYDDLTFMQRIITLQEDQLVILDYVETLNNPPDGYEGAYEKLVDTCDTYITFTNMIVNLDGSYNSFAEEFGKIDHSLAEKIHKFSLYIDNIEQEFI